VVAENRFWADLAQEFRALHNRYPYLRADWHHKVKSSRPGEWRVLGAGSQTAVAQFEALARRAAAALPNPYGLELHINWLDHMRCRSDRFRFGPGDRFEQNPDGSGRVELLEGTICRVSEAAADFCLTLEGDALEAGRRDEVQLKPSEPATLIPDSPQMVAEEGLTPHTGVTNRGKRGPKCDFETAMKVDEVTLRLAPDGKWRAQLDAVCEDLDEAQVRRPKRWTGKGYKTWYDCMIAERPLVIKAIEHHLKRAREHKKTFS
jgi:hypothetical protein